MSVMFNKLKRFVYGFVICILWILRKKVTLKLKILTFLEVQINVRKMDDNFSYKQLQYESSM